MAKSIGSGKKSLTGRDLLLSIAIGAIAALVVVAIGYALLIHQGANAGGASTEGRGNWTSLGKSFTTASGGSAVVTADISACKTASGSGFLVKAVGSIDSVAVTSQPVTLNILWNTGGTVASASSGPVTAAIGNQVSASTSTALAGSTSVNIYLTSSDYPSSVAAGTPIEALVDCS